MINLGGPLLLGKVDKIKVKVNHSQNRIDFKCGEVKINRQPIYNFALHPRILPKPQARTSRGSLSSLPEFSPLSKFFIFNNERLPLDYFLNYWAFLTFAD